MGERMEGTIRLGKEDGEDTKKHEAEQFQTLS